MYYGSGKYTYELIEDWAKCPEEFLFHNAYSVAADSNDRLYVVSDSPNQVVIFGQQGNMVDAWSGEHLKRSHGICIDRVGSVFCTDIGNHTVTRFSPQGKPLMVLGKPGQPSDTGYEQRGSLAASMVTIKKGGPPFNSPTGVTTTPAGEIYVSDGYGNARVHKFDSSGQLLLSWGEPGNRPGEFMIPHSVRIDMAGRVWVVDRENNRIQVFTDSGIFLFQLTDLLTPTDVCFDNEDTVYVSELGLRVSIFNTRGKLLARWGSDGQDKQNDLFVAPHGIAIDSKKNLYVSEVGKGVGKVERGTRTVRKFIRRSA